MPQRGHPSQEGLWALAGPFMERESDPEADGLLDLSFLTEEEQEAIAEVLKRDAHLRQLEEGRVSKLRASLADPGQLKTLTGDWFQEARSQRHHHVHFGSDLVRASIRRKKGSRGGQAQGSNGEAEAAEKEAEEALEPSLPRDEATQEKLSEAEGPDFPSPYVPLKASEDEEQPQAQEAPGPRGALVHAAEEADPEPERLSRGEVEPQPPPAQTQATSEIQENGEEAPGLDPSLDRMLSSSSSMSSLNSSTLSGSQMSLSGEAEAGAVQVRGSVHFALRYEAGAAELRVHVIQCQGLATARRRRLDPYVKSYLLPDKQSKRKTSVKKRNLNPVFNETLRYSVPQAELQDRVLNLSVWHRESLGRNIFLGEVEVPLDTWDWDSEPTWLPLRPRVSPSPDYLPSRGLLSLSLKYVPAGSEGAGLPPTGELHFWVKEAQDLVPLRSGSLDTYIQCSVLPDDSRASRQRTRVVRRNLSPVFNHTMVYDGFGPADLRQACAELSLWDHGALASHQLGGIRLSLGTGSSYGLQVPWMDSTSEEKQLWETLLERPCEWVDGLLPLRTNLAPRT
ncbi:synaptotagmin-like protein 1 [Camelus dromedarius]|uniref:synaptotagmin-like protein 1 n=1 Tax=Camelus dromedarius TaxID=9838 RepID=UPI001263E384|nr:synaptotagmin-like protein 1 isoform X1 [Camelus dromedarius]XP_031320326.1 synaptotagmin-like protein 1 isoform X1 [Camelus dromedarius]XP_031320327.1 synaptotagmin-like protein 1 isoform X1 [Camelus dromedarius]XP_031320328.1 synaptotagmin-like protein 1 isoform X1 [Camelus dromedarius]